MLDLAFDGLDLLELAAVLGELGEHEFVAVGEADVDALTCVGSGASGCDVGLHVGASGGEVRHADS